MHEHDVVHIMRTVMQTRPDHVKRFDLFTVKTQGVGDQPLPQNLKVGHLLMMSGFIADIDIGSNLYRHVGKEAKSVISFFRVLSKFLKYKFDVYIQDAETGLVGWRQVVDKHKHSIVHLLMINPAWVSKDFLIDPAASPFDGFLNLQIGLDPIDPGVKDRPKRLNYLSAMLSPGQPKFLEMKFVTSLRKITAVRLDIDPKDYLDFAKENDGMMAGTLDLDGEIYHTVRDAQGPFQIIINVVPKAVKVYADKKGS